MNFLNKIKWILGILLVFALIITTNLVDRRNFLRVKDAVAAMYEDRLLAKGLIVEVMELFQKKELAAATSDTAFYATQNTQVNRELEGLLQSFGETRLTQTEQEAFGNLLRNFDKLKALEEKHDGTDAVRSTQILKQLSENKGYLQKLSAIQLSEGRRQMAITEKAIDSVEFYTQIEIYILIFLAIAIQVVVIYTPKEK